MKKVAVALMLVVVALLARRLRRLAARAAPNRRAAPKRAPKKPAAKAGSAGAKKPKAGEEAAGGGQPTLKIAAAESGLAYASDTASVEAGEVKVEFENPQPIAHDVAIETFNGEVLGQTETIAEGSDSTEIELKPGTYKFFCTVPGHREAGMEGTLTVE